MATERVRHFLEFSDLSRAELEHVFARTRIIKDRFKRYQAYQPLTDRTLAMVFEKASTRTRVSFEAGMYQMGGSVIHLTTGDSQLGRAEPIEDTARVISRMVDIVMIRTFEQSKIERFANNSRVPVINGLTNEYHPCQILADIYTFLELRGPIQGRTVAWSGDDNNVLASWAHAAERFKFKLNVATPPQLAPNKAMKEWIKATQAPIVLGSDPEQAVSGADCVVTDTWVSMGDKDGENRHNLLRPYQVNGALMKLAKRDAIFMHCLPAHRGEEVSADVIDGPQSAVWDEAENRLHAQKALLEYLLLGRDVE